MAKGNNQKIANGSALNFEAQIRAAAEQGVPAADCNRWKRWPCTSTPRNADSFRQDLHPDLKADFILANPPFNMSDWGGENLRQDVRWKFGMPPVNNANYAWIQHFIHHLSPGGTGTSGGVAGFVLANGSMSTQTSNEGEIRRAIRN